MTAQQLDPEQGLRQLRRLIVRRGIKDAEARQALLADAVASRASLCPQCYDLVPLPQNAPAPPMSVCRGRLSAGGYRVEVEHKGLVRWVEVETPGRKCIRPTAPGLPLTRKGALLFLVAPVVLAALVVAILNNGTWLLVLVVAFLLLALVLAAVVQRGWGYEGTPDDRAVDWAWTWLAPRLHSEGFSLEDSAFLASLAGASLGRGDREVRRPILEHLLSLTGRVVRMGFGGGRHLAALRRLAMADELNQKQDPVRLVAAEIDRCFRGELPLAYADGLLEPGEQRAWSRGERAQLRVLLCDSAFEAGFEIRDLLEAGEAAPSLGAVLNCRDVEELALLRLLWSLRATRPWDRHGKADTVFDLAAQASSTRLLDCYPDLLLCYALPDHDDQVARNQLLLVLCGRGVILGQTLFTRPPRSVEIRSLKETNGRFELIADGQYLMFSYNPERVATRLDALVSLLHR